MRTRCAHGCVLVGLLLTAGCPQPRDDGFEPNDSPETATVLQLNDPIQARTVQDNPDVYAVEAPAGSLVFRLDTIEGQVCPAFTVTAPDGTILFRDTHRFCSRTGSTPDAIPGVQFGVDDAGYTLRVPAQTAGRYVLTVRELGYADNIIDTFWEYTLTAGIP